MQRALRYRVVSIALCTALGAVVALTACSDYEEGDRCEALNGNDDCGSPLVCTPKAQINTPYNTSDRCCPADRASATHPACKLQQSPVTGDAAPSDANTGPAPDATVDSPVETSAPVEAGSDADADAADADEGG